MNDQIRDNNECKGCCTLLVDDFFDKLFDKYLIAFDDFTLSSRINKSMLKTLSLKRIIDIRDSLKEIFDYNHDFNEIAMNFFFRFKSKTKLRKSCKVY